MTSYESTPVDDRTDDHFFLAEISVAEGDDLIVLSTEDSEYRMPTHMTVDEATSMILALVEAIAVAVGNRA